MRYFGVPLVEVFFSEEKLHRIKFLKTTPKRDFIFFIIFMIPGTPKDLLCYFAGADAVWNAFWICEFITAVVVGIGIKYYWNRLLQ